MSCHDPKLHVPSPAVARSLRQLDRIYMPAMPPLGLIEAIGKRLRELRQRRSLRRLLALDDHMLADLGHCRRALQRVLALPLSVDAFAALGECPGQSAARPGGGCSAPARRDTIGNPSRCT